MTLIPHWLRQYQRHDLTDDALQEPSLPSC